MKRAAVMRRFLPAIRIPFCNRLRRPLRRAVGVALGASVGRADRHRQIWPRDAYAVIASVVHHHIVLRWHVAVDALRAGGARRMPMMRGDVEFFRQVALGAQGIAFSAQLCGVWFMTIGTDDAGFMHGAL